jgi:hypothetical protein
MGLAGRIFLLDDQDGLYRLPNAVFARMLENPVEEPLPRFSGARVRMADLILTLHDRRPDRIVHATFSILHFDDHGCLIASEFDRQQRALADIALAAEMDMPGSTSTNVLDATRRFVARGGAWTPKHALLRRIYDAALDRTKYNRL